MKMTVLDIQRMSSEDGPGLRTTAFFKGCPLSCGWCHNPESIGKAPVVQWQGVRCLGCRSCVKVCRHAALSISERGVAVNRGRCTDCLECSAVCPSGAMEQKGYYETPQKLADELVRDRAYFGADGGVTLSGGEPLLQDGVIELLTLLRQQKVNTAVDTCGLVPAARLQEVLPLCDMVLFDLKLADSAAHKAHTGAPNGAILKNFETVCAWAKNGGRLWIRTPVIPNATDSDENISAIAEIIRQGGGAERYELCAFNNLCRDKYERLSIEWRYKDAPLMQKSRMEQLAGIARSILNIEVRATGACREESTDE